MRIVHVVHNFTGLERGGTELYAEALATEQARRHDVEVFSTETDREGRAFSQGPARVGVLPVTVVRRPLPHSLLERRAHQREIERRFDAFLARRGANVVHVHHLIDGAAGALAVPPRRGIPQVLSLPDYWWVCPRVILVRRDDQQCVTGPRLGFACMRHCRPATERHPPFPARPEPLPPLRPRDLAFVYRAVRNRWLLRSVPLFLAPSRYVADQHARLGVGRGRTEVVPWGVDPGFAPSRVPRDGPLRVAALGLVSRAKGTAVLIDAFRDVDPEHARLTVHGHLQPAEAADLHRLFASAPNVRWAGPYARDDVGTILAEADVVVVASRWAETYVLVVHEAFLHGVPVIAARMGALTESVRDGESGLQFDGPGELREAVERLADDPALLERLRQGVRPPPTMEEHARQIESLYGRVIGS